MEPLDNVLLSRVGVFTCSDGAVGFGEGGSVVDQRVRFESHPQCTPARPKPTQNQPRTMHASAQSLFVSVRFITCPLSSTKFAAISSASSAWRALFIATENRMASHISTAAWAVTNKNATAESAATWAAPMRRRL